MKWPSNFFRVAKINELLVRDYSLKPNSLQLRLFLAASPAQMPWMLERCSCVTFFLIYHNGDFNPTTQNKSNSIAWTNHILFPPNRTGISHLATKQFQLLI